MLRPSGRGASLGALILALGLLPAGVLAQAPQRVDAAERHAEIASPRPEFRARREIAVSSVGSALLVVGHFLPVDRLVVPPAGLDPAGIVWGPDRAVVGRSSGRADHASDWTLNASLLFPLVIAIGVTPSGSRWQGLAARGALYAETMLVSQGTTALGKSLWNRARPYAYLPEADRLDAPSFDVEAERTFRSMPSGHSSTAWTGVTMGLTEHLLSRPDASTLERSAIGFVGGGLAGATSSLRVEGGQHFPSDVLVGAALGVVTGVAVPLMHRGRRSMPTTAAWLETVGGVLAGTLTAVLVTR